MPLQQTSGNVTADAYGGGVAAKPNYIEDVFSTYLTTGTSATLIVNNGIDLAGKGGLVWQKGRNSVVGPSSNTLFDTARGVNQLLQSNSTSAQINAAGTLTSFNSNGFEIGSNNNLYVSGQTGVNWTFRKQPKFFDVQTATVGASNTLTFSHALGSTPGFIMVKTTANAGGWVCYHRSLGNDKILQLQSTSAAVTVTGAWTVSSTSVTLAGAIGTGEAVVAYLYAHNAGGFGLTGTDNVISCGSFTTDGSGKASVTLGYEPQWLLLKNTNGTNYDWVLMDTMRGWTANTSSSEASLYPNLSDAETVQSFGNLNATGFNASGWYAGQTIIYIAIRRGPMKVPTSGTSVFKPVAQTGDSNISVGFPTDFGLRYNRAGGATIAVDRLRGAVGLYTPLTDAESAASTVKFDLQNLMTYGLGAGASVATYQWQRAPSFFDEVCYTGNGTGSTQIAHNLGVAPTLVIVKQRSGSSDRSWWVLTTAVPQLNILNDTSAANAYGVPANLFGDSTYNNYIAPTATTLTLSPSSEVNNSGSTYVAYLFATCAGVSKVGSYTGTGATQTINCGFTGGARFVLIKRTDSTGDWYVYDTARGMTTLTDPYLRLNSTAAESATLGSVTTVSTGFAVNASILAAINTNGASYIYLSIA